MGKLIPFLILAVLCVGWWRLSRRAGVANRAAAPQSPPAHSGGEETEAVVRPRAAERPASGEAPADRDPAARTEPDLRGWRPLVRAELTPEAITEARADVEGFPELPVTTRQIMLGLQNPQTEPPQIARLVASDPALAARILRAVNSALFSLPNKVGDLSRAVVLLGYSQVRGLVLRGGMGHGLLAHDGRTPIDLTPFWFHSFCTATSAFHVSKAAGWSTPGLAATVGLLHDIGKPVLWWGHPAGGLAQATADGVATEQSTGTSLLVEESSWGAGHPAVGALLAVRWGLPTEVVRGIEYHHHPEFVPPSEIPPEAREIALVVWIADQLAHWFAGLNDEERALGELEGGQEIVRRCWEKIGRGPLPPVIVEPSLMRELNRARQLLEVAEGEAAAAGVSARGY